jgi:hypothetical protein
MIPLHTLLHAKKHIGPRTAKPGKELGDAYELAEMGEKATIEGLMKVLGVQDRLEAMFDKCLKRGS